MKFRILAFLFVAGPAIAADHTPWVEPPLGEISVVGTTIETESYRCSVESQRQIRCINIGRVCAAYRKEEEKRNARMFGCAIESSPNYPCEPWALTRKHIEETSRAAMGCTPLLLGGY